MVKSEYIYVGKVQWQRIGLGKQEMSCSSWRCTYNCIAHFSFSSDDLLIELLSIPVSYMQYLYKLKKSNMIEIIGWSYGLMFLTLNMNFTCYPPLQPQHIFNNIKHTNLSLFTSRHTHNVNVMQLRIGLPFHCALAGWCVFNASPACSSLLRSFRKVEVKSSDKCTLFKWEYLKENSLFNWHFC